MSKKMRILLTNDDGYFSDGIKVLFRELSKSANVYMVAPDREQSASSHSLTLERPLRVQKLGERCYTIDGTPTDCVMLGVHMVLKRRPPHMIISGINHGANMGEDVTYSGTVAAAIEGSILGIPSLAVSMVDWALGTPMTRAARFVCRMVSRYRQLGLDPATFLNINLPPDSGRPYRRFRFTSLGVRQYRDYVIHKTDPRGKAYYWIGGYPTWKATPGSDFEAVDSGSVSITPLKLDFTDSGSLKRLQHLDLKVLS
ncbi:MAG: 5'/3'-nucleotidase SurE [bacterium]